MFHTPPDASELPERLALMCDFANGKSPDYFIHPVIRGIILHFWLAYDHPFVDGNGRTARALFYWLMLHSGYWLFEFISLSQILRQAPVQYGTAFLHTETDDNDLTYFIIHQSEVIKKGLIELHDYVARKSRETRATMAVLQGNPDLNHRQQAVLAHAIRHPGFSYNIAGHMARHGIVYDTARLDLLGLADRGWLEQRKAGKTHGVDVPIVNPLCTLTLSRRLDPDRQLSHRLTDLCARYGVELVRPHDALADADATAAVLPHLLQAHGITSAAQLSVSS